MLVNEFDYYLPTELIAAFPTMPRDNCKLLVFYKGKIIHSKFYNLPEFLFPGDLLVFNDSKVIKARLFCNSASGKNIEILLLKPKKNPSFPKNVWECLIKKAKKIKANEELYFKDGSKAKVLNNEKNIFSISFDIKENNFLTWLDKYGSIPLPPYIKRPVTLHDDTAYQTIYSKKPGSVAAPTAGLHFTDTLIDSLHNKGIETESLTLHISYGSFSPIRTQEIEEHSIAKEYYVIPDSLIEKIHSRSYKRIISVGTSTIRALESIKYFGREGETSLYITPGYKFEISNCLITNFHLPKTSLYILVTALLGINNVRVCYEEAIKNKYSFYSYGDAMLSIVD